MYSIGLSAFYQLLLYNHTLNTRAAPLAAPLVEVTMPSTAGVQCTLKELSAVAPDSHPWRGGCDGRLPGLCGSKQCSARVKNLSKTLWSTSTYSSVFNHE